MYKIIVIFLLMIISNFCHSYTVIVTEYGEILEIKNGIEKRTSIKALGGVYHVSKEAFESKGVKGWVDISKEDKIKKRNLTPLSYFSDIDPKPYFNDCYIYYEAESEVHISLKSSGEIMLERLSIHEGKVIKRVSPGQLKQYNNVVVIVDMYNEEIIISSEVSEKNNELLVFSDPKFNEWELQYAINDCATGDRIYPKNGSN